MTDFVGSLVEMGFLREQAEKAVEQTGNTGIQNAIDWIISHPDVGSSNSSSSASTQDQQSLKLSTNNITQKEPDPSSAGAENPTNEEGKSDSAVDDRNDQGVARSYKCDDCGRILKDVGELEFHAAKSKHSNFSESTEEKKPLTPEEKAAQLEIIKEKLRIKKLEREEQEKRDALDREKMRMKSGKELQEAKRRLEEQEMKEIQDTRRREKAEDAKARARVKAQIEADKIARKEKFGGVGTNANNSVGAVSSSPSASTVSTTSNEPAPKKDYQSTKLQIRLTDGKTIIQTFGSNEPLAAVRLYVELNRTDGVTGANFNLMTTFPRKVYEGEDYEKPLDALGLVPSAVLIVCKSTPVF